MKKEIHPEYFKKSKVSCACGNSFIVGSTKEFLQTEICSQCHPFYTGKKKIVDTLGQVQKFKERAQKSKKK